MKIFCRQSWHILPLLLLSTSIVQEGNAQRTSVVASSTSRLRGLIGDTTSNNNDVKGDAGSGPGAGGGAGASATDSTPSTTTSTEPDSTKPGAGGGGAATKPGSGGGGATSSTTPGSGGPGGDATSGTGSTTTDPNTSPHHTNEGPTTGTTGGAATGPDATTTTTTGPNATAGSGEPTPLPSHNSTEPPPTNATSSSTPPAQDAASGPTILGSSSSSVPSGVVGDYTIVNGHVEFAPNSTEALWLEWALAKLKAQQDSSNNNPGLTGSQGTAGSSSGSGTMPEIIDGEQADPGDFPFMVLSYRDECGGTLVAKDVVMTAAHCRGAFGGEVLVGAYRVNSTEGGAEWRKVLSTMQIHPDYDPDFFYNDVMLFQIEPSTLQPVELNMDPNDDPLPGANLTTAGFGYVLSDDDFFPEVPEFLQKVTVQSIDGEICNTLWDYVASQNFFEVSFQPDIMTCTMGIYNDGDPQGPCFGDSGGPLLDESGKQVGIVSWGADDPFSCSAPIVPAVYTRVTGVIDFIQEAICKLTSDPSALPFTCPDFVCPPDVTILGFDNLKVPSAIDDTRTFNGFTPVTVTQVPRAGSRLGFAKDTTVKVTATDGSGTSHSCNWKVSVPDEVPLGIAVVETPPGPSTTRTLFYFGGTGPGLMYFFRGVINDGRLGPRGVANARFRIGTGNLTSPALPLTQYIPEAIFFLDDLTPLDYLTTSRVVVTARNVRRSTLLVYLVYGQQTDFLGLPIDF